MNITLLHYQLLILQCILLHILYRFKNSNYHLLMFFVFFPFRTIPNGLNNITNIILFCILTFFLFMFYPFMMLNNRITDLIFCNFYDLLFFRYGAFYVIIVYVNIVFTSDSNVISVITVVILIIFVIKVLQYYRY